MKNENWLLFLAFVLQIFALILGNDLVFYYFINVLHGTPKSDISWGLKVEEIYINYFLIAMVQLVASMNLPNAKLWVAVLFSVIYSLIIIPFLDHHPYRASALLVLGLVGIWIQVCLFFVRRIASKKK